MASVVGGGRQHDADLFTFAQTEKHHYIALGCLINDSSAISSHTAAPKLISQSNASLDAHAGDTVRLVNAAWISIESVDDHLKRDFLQKQYIITRVYILPQDVARRQIDRNVSSLRVALLNVIRRLDINPRTWQGNYDPASHTYINLWAQGVDESLFYMFNMLQSPAPSTKYFQDKKHKYVREAMEDVLGNQWFTGLQATLYPYQRRSAALMLEREERSTLQLDPRLEPRTGPDGQTYFFHPREHLFYKEPLYYESCRGGILAETMGLGKTLICLTLILATRHHLPKIPPDYSASPAPSKLKSLQQTAVTAIQQNSIPWQVELRRIEHHTGDDNSSTSKLLLNNPPTYTIPVLPTRWNRKTIMPPPKHLTLASTTLVVVPRNLCKQWQSEMSKHLIPDALSVLIMDDLRQDLPPAHELRQFDVVLFTRSRFEMEARDGADDQGRRLPPAHTPLICRCPYIGATRERDCRCLQPNDVYDSPLKHLHFKRLIIDEGHSFSASNTKAVAVANKLVVADHRWIVSGTPAKDLIGVELGLALDDTSQQSDIITRRESALHARRQYNARSEEADAVKSLGALASNFLQVRPWYSGDSGEPAAVWDEHIYRHEDLRKRTHTCYSNSLRRTLDAMVIKTRPEDVERDMILPPLVHTVVRLDPSFFDKATANLFSLVLIANAVTSERTDQDYIFHKNNAKARTQLIANLRQSSFFWSGFSQAEVEATVKTSRAYLNKAGVNCSEQDRQLMLEASAAAEQLIASQAWRMLGQTHELGVYVDGWPENSADFWSFDHSKRQVLTGMTQLLEAQRHVDQQIGSDDLGAGLAGAGIKSLATARNTANEGSVKQESTVVPGVIASSSLKEDLVLKKRASTINLSKTSPTRVKAEAALVADVKFHPIRPGSDDGEQLVESISNTSTLKRSWAAMSAQLGSDSEYRNAQIVGTTSAKLSYLITQIVKHAPNEKIIVFYDGDHIAYYIAQTLEFLHIKHEIYAKSLAASLKSEYVVRFDQGTMDRVLLMDVKQAAFGLNVSSASRIYFVNPVCRPDIEAQAVKRAHRIGQTRPVHVETLILKGTLEEKMHERAQRMTRSEHLDAKVLEDDRGMREILQSASIIPYSDDEHHEINQMAPIAPSQQLWGRPGWQDALDAAEQLESKKSRKRQKRPNGQSVQKGKQESSTVPFSSGSSIAAKQ